MSSSNESVLSKPEIYILLSLMSNQTESGHGVQKHIISDNLKSTYSNDTDFINYIEFKLNLNIERLIEKKLIERSNGHTDPTYALTSAGTKWLFENEDRLPQLLSLKMENNHSHNNFIESKS